MVIFLGVLEGLMGGLGGTPGRGSSQYFMRLPESELRQSHAERVRMFAIPTVYPPTVGPTQESSVRSRYAFSAVTFVAGQCSMPG